METSFSFLCKLQEALAARLQEKLGLLVFQAVVCHVALLFRPTVGDRPRGGDEL